MMFKKIFFAIALQGSAMLFAQDGVLKITVTSKDDGEPLELSNVVLESAGVVARTATTDAKGNLTIKNLSSGKYNVKSSYVGYQKTMITDVRINNGETTYLELKLSAENMLKEFTVEEYHIEKYEKPLIDPNTSIKKIFDFDDIKDSPYKDVNDFMSTAVGAVQEREGMTPHFKGGREGSVQYIIDGQPVHGSYNLPHSAIQQMSVTLGGIPAQYGDATGAFIEIETRSGLVNPHK